MGIWCLSLNNLLLIGMPGSGKSTLGVLLAKATARDFVDTDLLIQQKAAATLQQVLDLQGHLVLRELEAGVLLSLDVRDTVIATGGSAVYSDAAMAHLKSGALCLYLHLSLEAVEARIHDMQTRGIARPPGQSFEEMFKERDSLYRHYADHIVCMDDLKVEQSLQALRLAVNQTSA